ncbi:MAG TPA: protein kinase, partial [Polyangiaceae bacterium]|nr:protein kinase [Polyangiaceae bacterium]
ILQQVARAVARAHDAGIVHRDLKPDNVFLVRDDDLEIAKVLDFGIAKRTSITGENTSFVRTETGAMLGTPLYMSPEQAGGKKDVDHLTDIWSFGVIACECLIGARVFNADTLGGLVLAICSEPIPIPSATGFVTPAFDAWFFRCIARDRSQRYQSIRDASAGLVTLLRGESARRDSLNDSELSQIPLRAREVSRSSPSAPSAPSLTPSIPTEHAGSPAVQAISNAVAPNSDSMPTGASLAPNFALTQPPSTNTTGKQQHSKVPRWMVPIGTGFALTAAVLVAAFVWLPTPNGEGASASGRSPLGAVEPEPAQIASSQAFGLADAATTLASPAQRVSASADSSATPPTSLTADVNAVGATSSGSVSSPSVSPVPSPEPSRPSAASAKSAAASTRPIPNSPRPLSSPVPKASVAPAADQPARARSKIDLAL